GPRTVLAVGRGAGWTARSVSVRRYVWHFTTANAARGIRGDCDFLASASGTDGPGVYFTDLAPGHDRARLSRALWNAWRAARMQAHIRVPFDPADMLQSERHEHVFFVPGGGYSLHGMDDLAIGFWTGADPSDPADMGSWREEPFSCLQ
ncbi:MAG: hypothetical protein AAB295_08355, partial [Chloroflexota bacterium]